MGAFLLAKTGYPGFDKRGAFSVFETMGLSNPTEFTIGSWSLWSWRKIRSNEDHFLVSGDATLVCVGTPIYKGSGNLVESLRSIFEELQSNTFDYRNVRGNYGLVYSPDGNEIRLLTDQSGTWNIYFDSSANIISSSFLAVVFGLRDRVTLNRFAAAEVISSGRLMGPDTLFNEVSRLEISLAERIGDITVINDKALQDFPAIHKFSFDDCVADQLRELDSYFEDIKNFGCHYGVDSGLTGGHDSRMMLIQGRKFFDKFQVHSFWRRSKDAELKIAGTLAEKAGLPLKVVEARHHLDKTNEQMRETLRRSLFFYDGHIRMHCFLVEDYHSIEHRTAILGDKFLGMNGIGGEQYRNEWHMESPQWSVRYFTRYAMTWNISGKSFTDQDFEDGFFRYLESKLLRKLGSKGRSSLSKKNIKKYYNEIYVASLLGARTNAENTLGHFITPLVDRQLTKAAYRSLPHQGISYDFQQAMIRKMDPELASVQSGYGYSFTTGEPFKKKLKYILKELTPPEIYQRKIEKKINAAGNKDFKEMLKRYPVLRESVAFLQQFELPIDEKKITSVPDIMPVYLSLAYFLYYLSGQQRIQLNPKPKP